MGALSCILVIFCFLLNDTNGRMMGGGGYQRERGDRWRRRPWEVGYHGNRNNPRRPWDRVWQNRRKQDEDVFIVKTERPRYYESEENSCTGLCLIKKMEALNTKIENKEKKDFAGMLYSERVQNPEFTKPKKDKAPCTG